MQYVTYSELLALIDVIISIIGLILAILAYKKK